MEYNELTPAIQKDMPSLSGGPQVTMPTLGDAAGGGNSGADGPTDKPKRESDTKAKDNTEAEDVKLKTQMPGMTPKLRKSRTGMGTLQSVTKSCAKKARAFLVTTMSH